MYCRNAVNYLCRIERRGDRKTLEPFFWNLPFWSCLLAPPMLKYFYKNKGGRSQWVKSLSPLFTPWKIGNCEIKNRFVLTSMGGTDLFGWMEKNHFDKDGARFILEVAKTTQVWLCPAVSRSTTPCSVSGCTKTEKMFADLKNGCRNFTRPAQSSLFS